MIRKTVLLCVIVPVLYATYSGIAACSAASSKARVCNINFYADGHAEEDTAYVSGLFRFTVIAQFEDLCLAAAGNPFIGSCYAFKKCYTWQNGLDTATFRLSFNKNIVTGSDTLFADTDILKHASFGKYASLGGGGTQCAYINYTIGTNDATATNKMVFESGIYRATFSCKTTDGALLYRERYMRFKQ